MPWPEEHGSSSSAASREELLPQPVAPSKMAGSSSSLTDAATAAHRPAAAAPSPVDDEIEEAEGHEAAPHLPLLGSRAGKPPSSSSHLHNVAAAAGLGDAAPGAGRLFAAPSSSGSHHMGAAISKAALAAAESEGGAAGRGIARLEVEGVEDEEGRYGSAGNPVRRFLRWVLSFTVPGMGMFSEAYFVFSIGNLKGIFSEAYPDCWQSYATCPKDLVHTLTYSQVAGIIAGQLGISWFADRLGRKWGSVLCAAFMLLFGILIACSAGGSPSDLFLMFTICQALFGIGVGGEYPVASTSASERAEQSESLRRRRGETTLLTFSMQGWGNFANTLVLVLLMAAFQQTQPPYNQMWRLSYIIGLAPIAFMLVWRIWWLKESEVWRKGRQSAQELERQGASNSRKQRLFLRHYWHRVAGPALIWAVWDLSFYGNKLFQSTFISVLNPGANLIQTLQWTLLNSAVALAGYYAAAFTVDKPWIGRKRMQAQGFAWQFVLFLICAAFYPVLVGSAIHVLQLLYYLSSFWGQFGPNATTWLLPAELVPTELRSRCHGFASAVGKAGALAAGVIFGLVGDRTKFWISAISGLVGVLLTVLLIPDITELDLREGDARWQAIAEGREESYTGPAVDPRHLSYLERWLGYGTNYVPPHPEEGALSAGEMKR